MIFEWTETLQQLLRPKNSVVGIKTSVELRKFGRFIKMLIFC